MKVCPIGVPSRNFEPSAAHRWIETNLLIVGPVLTSDCRFSRHVLNVSFRKVERGLVRVVSHTIIQAALVLNL